MYEEYDYVIIGGGIAGTSCAQRVKIKISTID